MNNAIEYKINIGGNASSELDKIGRSSQSLSQLGNVINVLNKISTQMEKLFTAVNFGIVKNQQGFSKLNQQLFSMRNVGMSTEKTLKDGMTQIASSTSTLTGKMKELRSESQKTGKQIKENIFQKFGDGAINFNNIVGAFQNLGSMVAPIFQEGMMRETAATNFGTLFNDKEKGKAYADTLRSTDAAALYGTQTINDAAQSMLAYGVDSDTTLDVLTAIGDIAMGDKQKMNSLATAFSQMNSLGKLQTQDWKQMVGGGFNPFNQMQKDLGKTAEELDAMMNKGQITADMVKNAFINATKEGGQFAGALKNVMENTTQGKIAKMQGLIDDLKAKLFDLAVPLMNKLLPIITKLMPLIDNFIPVINGIMTVLEPVANWIAENIDHIFALATAIGVVAGAIALCTSPITGIVLAIAGLVYALVNVMKYWDQWGKYVVLISPPLAVVMNLIMAIRRHWDSIVDGFTNGGILEGIKRIGLTILDALLAPIQNLLELISKIPGVGKLADGLNNRVMNLRDKINNMLPEPKKEQTQADTQQNLEESVNSIASGGGIKDLDKATKSKTEAVASGGSRSSTININLGSMVENMNFNGTVEENNQSITSQVEECLLRVLYSAQTAI